MDSPADRLHFTAIYKSVANLQKKMGKRWEGIKKRKAGMETIPDFSNAMKKNITF